MAKFEKQKLEIRQKRTSKCGFDETRDFGIL